MDRQACSMPSMNDTSNHMNHSGHHAEEHRAFKLGGVHCIGCADAVEEALRAQPHITGVHVDWPNNVVHVRYHAGMIGPDAIEAVIASTGCACEVEDTPAGEDHDHAGHAMPGDTRRMQHLGHAVDVQPITMKIG